MSGEPSTVTAPIPTSLPIPEGYTESLAPWTLEAEAWWILPPVPMPWQPKELPKGALDPFEEKRLGDLKATYTGGLGTIQLIRYHSSPVGPYDELLYVPGNMKYQVGSSTISGLSITRIYVSSAASVVNGRRNWNIPKHLARFEFTRETPSDPLSPVTASVYPATSASAEPEFAVEPIFRAKLSPSRRLPEMPLNLAKVPQAILDPRLFQAPLNGTPGSLVVGTEHWCTIAPAYSGHIRVLYPEPGLEGGKYGDGVGFPDLQPMSIGLWWPKASIVFPEPTILNPGEAEDSKTK